MKATGIVRRIDDLGRVIIPKELRRSLRIYEGDPLELFTDSDSIVLKKYNVVGMIEDSESLLRSIQQIIQAPVLLCDRDKVIDATGISKAKYEGHAITDELYQIIDKRNLYMQGEEKQPIRIFVEDEMIVEMVMPIAVNGEVFGALVIPKSGGDFHRDNALLSLKLAAKYLNLHLERI